MNIFKRNSKNKPKIISFLSILLFSGLLGLSQTTPINNGKLASDLNGNNKNITNLLGLTINLTNTGYATTASPYGDYGKLVFGTNNGSTGSGVTVLVPNYFALLQADGSSIRFWPYPDHGGGGLIHLASQRDVTVGLGPNGNLQLGHSGSAYNGNVYLQYADDIGNSTLFMFATRVGSTVSYSAIHGYQSGTDGWGILNFYSKAPTWNTFPTTGFNTSGALVFQMETNGVNIRGRNVNLKSVSSASIISVDFSTGLLQDASPSSANVTITISNNDGSITNIVRKILYIHSNGQALNLTWPSGINIIGETLTNLPSSLASSLLLRTEWEATGPGNTNIQVSFKTGIDNSFTWDTDASAFFTAASITDGTQKAAIDTFVKARKAHGTWDSADRIALFVGGNSTAHSKYIKGSGTITFTSSPTHNTNGVTFNGTSQFADSAFVPSADGVNYTVNSDRLIVCISTNSAYPISANAAYAAVSATTYTGLLYDGSSLFSYGNNAVAGSSGMSFVISDIRGVICTTRTAASVGGLYINGQSLAGPGLTATALPTASITIGCRRWGTGIGEIDRYGAYTCAGFEIGAGVDTSTYQSIRDDWLAFNNALSR